MLFTDGFKLLVGNSKCLFKSNSSPRPGIKISGFPVFGVSPGAPGIVFRHFGAQLRKSQMRTSGAKHSPPFLRVSGPSGKFSDLTDLRDIDHFIVKFKLHSYMWFQAPDFIILESKLCFSGVVSNFQLVIQSASLNATVHTDRGSKFRDFQFSVFLREPRASFSGISARSCAKQSE